MHSIKIRKSLLTNENGDIRRCIREGIDKIMGETQSTITLLMNEDGSGSTINALQIKSWEGSIDFVKSGCFRLLDVSVIFPIMLTNV